MRDDFNKQLTERERFGHLDHYHNYRRMKLFENSDGDGPIGGREPMRARYRIGFSGKTFNENLNPLHGWLRSIVGQKWDKCYSELRQKFDTRRVINDHILQHLYSDLETKAYINAQGKTVVLSTSKWGSGSREVPIARCGSTYYVCPKDGTVKLSAKPLKRSVIMQRAIEKKREAEATKRVIDKHNVLHLIDGVWYHFELKEIPTVQVTYERPYGKNEFQLGYLWAGRREDRQTKTWDQLNEEERERFGRKVVKGGAAYDLFTGDAVYRDQKGRYAPRQWIRHGDDNLYHATKQTASKKLLKQAGL